MVKPYIEGETRDEKFRRIATNRTQRILKDIKLLGNCSNTNAYSYSREDVRKIFSAIDQEVKKTKALFSKTDEHFTL